MDSNQGRKQYEQRLLKSVCIEKNPSLLKISHTHFIEWTSSNSFLENVTIDVNNESILYHLNPHIKRKQANEYTHMEWNSYRLEM